jgi:hypothetical protein
MPRNDPVVLELASLAREQTGPFLLLGVDKTADKQTIEAHWADRVRWARKGQLKVPLEDVNWARNALADVEGRLRADCASLNLDLADSLLAALAARFGVGAPTGLRWQPRDREAPPASSVPAAEVPDPVEVAASVVLPEVPDNLPGVRSLLEQLAAAPPDPWGFELPDPEEEAP